MRSCLDPRFCVFSADRSKKDKAVRISKRSHVLRVCSYLDGISTARVSIPAPFSKHDGAPVLESNAEAVTVPAVGGRLAVTTEVCCW